MRVLVCGATGYLGGYVCRELKLRGHTVIALSRRPASKLSQSLLDNVDKVVVGSATKRDDLRNICCGVDVVFSCLGNHTFNRSPTFWEVDEKANLNILDSALEPGSSVGHFVFVSVLFGDQLRNKFDQAEARERVVDALKAKCATSSGFRFTVVRPSGFYNDMLDILNMSRERNIWLIGNGKSFLNPIHGKDIASFCVDKIESNAEGPSEKYYNVGGPEFLTIREIHRLAHQAWGGNSSEIRFRSVPTGFIRFIARIIKIFNSNVASVMNMFASLSTIPEKEMKSVEAYGENKLQEFFEQEVKKIKQVSS